MYVSDNKLLTSWFRFTLQLRDGYIVSVVNWILSFVVFLIFPFQSIHENFGSLVRKMPVLYVLNNTLCFLPERFFFLIIQVLYGELYIEHIGVFYNYLNLILFPLIINYSFHKIFCAGIHNNFSRCLGTWIFVGFPTCILLIMW